METSAWVDLYKQESTSVVNNLSNEELASFVDIILEAHDRESIVFACGNGGNVAYVGNLVVDLNMHPFVSEDKGARVAKRNKFHCVNLCDCAATITGISNDLGYEHIFSEQLLYQAKKDDVFFGITGSGNSKNVIKALEYAEQIGMKSVVVTRNEECRAKELADLLIVVRGESTFPGQTGKNNNNFHFEDCISKITHIAVGMLKKKVSQ
jgi:D-sedoheptulose 7-phosphate isomerase